MSSKHSIVGTDCHSPHSHLVGIKITNAGDVFEVVLCLQFKFVKSQPIIMERDENLKGGGVWHHLNGFSLVFSVDHPTIWLAKMEREVVITLTQFAF